MSTSDHPLGDDLRYVFKYLNSFMLLMWRLGLGPWLNSWPEGFGQIMVISHKGRKTNIKRCTPVNYAIVDEIIYCTAGFGPKSDWYRNIIANPEVEVWFCRGFFKREEWWAGIADVVSDPDLRLPLLRKVIIASGFASRLAGLNPYKMTQEEFAHATEKYQLLRIKLTKALTGQGGPGELSWIWPNLSVTLLFYILLLRLLRKKKIT